MSKRTTEDVGVASNVLSSVSGSTVSVDSDSMGGLLTKSKAPKEASSPKTKRKKKKRRVKPLQVHSDGEGDGVLKLDGPAAVIAEAAAVPTAEAAGPTALWSMFTIQRLKEDLTATTITVHFDLADWECLRYLMSTSPAGCNATEAWAAEIAKAKEALTHPGVFTATPVPTDALYNLMFIEGDAEHLKRVPWAIFGIGDDRPSPAAHCINMLTVRDEATAVPRRGYTFPWDMPGG